MQRGALIVGGGIAGPLTAMALQKAGIEASIYEAYPQSAGLAVGSFLTVAVNGLDALATLGLADAVRAVAFATPSIAFRSGSGKWLGQIPIGGARDGLETVTLERAALYRVLAEEATRRGIATFPEKRLVAAEHTRDEVIARFADGSEARGGMLIGCDGVHSRVREIIDTKAPRPRYTGLINLGGFSAQTGAGGLADAVPGTYEMIFGKRAFFGYVVVPSRDTPVWWFANVPCRRETAREELAAVTTAQWQTRLAALFADDETPAGAIVAANRGELRAFNTWEMPRVPRWHRERMIIIGDAAHAASPSSGQGASMAAEDAVALGRCLAGGANVDDAFARFERERRARVERVVQEGRRASSGKAAGPIGRVFRDLMMPRILKMVGNPKRSAWLHDHRSTWGGLAEGA